MEDTREFIELKKNIVMFFSLGYLDTNFIPIWHFNAALLQNHNDSNDTNSFSLKSWFLRYVIAASTVDMYI